MKQAALPILVLVIVVGLAILTSWPSTSLEADHYKKFQDGKSLYALLHSRIRTGQGLDELESILGPAVPLVEGVTEVRGQLQQEAGQYPNRFPQGVYDQDTFVTYQIENGKLLLQLRNGFLVNHDPQIFEEYSTPSDIAGGGQSVVPVEETAPAMIGGAALDG